MAYKNTYTPATVRNPRLDISKFMQNRNKLFWSTTLFQTSKFIKILNFIRTNSCIFSYKHVLVF